MNLMTTILPKVRLALSQRPPPGTALLPTGIGMALRPMIGVLTTYLAVAGGIAAGAQVGRGITRGVLRLLHGDPRGALAEAAGGLAAPALTAANQLYLLGQEVCLSAIELAVGRCQEVGSANGPWVPPARSPHRGRTAAPVDGAA